MSDPEAAAELRAMIEADLDDDIAGTATALAAHLEDGVDMAHVRRCALEQVGESRTFGELPVTRA